MENIMLQFAEILKTNPEHSYDYICQNYHKMSKEELANIIKELLFATNQAVFSGYIADVDEKTILANTAEELEELYRKEE